jgi:hypothetical protein
MICGAAISGAECPLLTQSGHWQSFVIGGFLIHLKSKRFSNALA